MQNALLSRRPMTNEPFGVNLQIGSRPNDLGMTPNELEEYLKDLPTYSKWEQPPSENVCYLRVSTDDQTIASQIEMTMATIYQAGLNPAPVEDGGDITYLIEKGGVSAWKKHDLRDRSKGTILHEWVTKDWVRNIFAFKLDRLFRSMAHGHMFCWNLKNEWKVDCDLRTCDLPMGYYGAGGKQCFAVLMMAAETESDAKSERSLAGMSHKRRSGGVSTKAQYGWDRMDRRNSEGDIVESKVEPNWAEQSIKEWCRYFNADENGGRSWAWLARQLNALGCKGKLGGKLNASGLIRMCNKQLQDEQLENFARPSRMPQYPWTNYRNKWSPVE